MLLDHIDLRVSNLAEARPLYDKLLSAMGYTRHNADESSVGYHRAAETEDSDPFIWLVEDPAHVANGTRIAFAASSRADVDRLAGIAKPAGAQSFEPPHLCTEYTAHYYAAFFEDAAGNKIEICYRRPE
jgi:catechol 2,3-dioxygenase-like lactoylglutathione lyase family enzyme